MSSGQQLRKILRQELHQFIDPGDDCMPYPNRVDGGYTWAPADEVIDRLVRAVHKMYADSPVTPLDQLRDRLDQLRELVDEGPPYDSNDLEWDCGWNTAMDEAKKILDGKEQP